MKTNIRLAVTFLIVLLLLPAASYAKQAKYVFLFIGDGMGIPQRAAANQYTGEKMIIENFPAQGITTTHALDRFITGSAAAATAMSCGKKTKIGFVGVDESMKPLKTIAEIAKEKGMKVGIVSSVSIDHATPAAFYAHVPSRGHYYDIDLALAKSGFDYFAGGTLKDPENKKNTSKNYQGNAWDIAKENGYKITENKKDFSNLSRKDGKVIATNSWIQDSGALPYEMDTTSEDITLAEFTEKGIELLDNKKGFFMMVEGGKIDWACHANDAAASIKDTIAFDNAIRKAYEFYKNHKDETLIVVTGDHECGGMTLGFAGTKYGSNYEILSNQKVSFQKFDDDVMKNIKKNDSVSFEDVKPYIERDFGLKFKGDKNDPMVLKSHEVTELVEAFYRSVSGETLKDPRDYILYGEYEPLTVKITQILNRKAGIGWTSYQHTGIPVTTSAVGKGYEKFHGSYDNTDIALKIMDAAGFGKSPVYASK
ncbi:MAG: alkaline phosphatase [Desulfobacteraceae bacterium]|nr:alkaline phosphatase [Desulfobacteraceae bacterium]MCB9495227.1 alkaline phosphatase [Desulfobacteraceae bacterium]